MLVLSRGVDEVIRIGPDVFVRVVSIRAGRVALGVLAPRGVEVMRSELEPAAGAAPAGRREAPEPERKDQDEA